VDGHAVGPVDVLEATGVLDTIVELAGVDVAEELELIGIELAEEGMGVELGEDEDDGVTAADELEVELTGVELVELEVAEEEGVGAELTEAEDEGVKAADELELEEVELVGVDDAEEELAEAELLVKSVSVELVEVTTAVELDRLVDDTVFDAIDELLLIGHAGTAGSGHPMS
jgi:hypothetical protein